MEPLTFTPLYMQRVWGGHELQRVYDRILPDSDQPYGESWEIVDREDDQSIVDCGPFAGTSIHTLWTQRREEIFGPGYGAHPRFPLLIKILDARRDLSIQVHPPADTAASLGGEAKTEMWFIADCDPGAKLYVGLKNGVTREDFEKAIANGRTAESVHAIQPKPGDSIFIPSGRLHAIGAGFLIHEIQQNSDTTYRVFDWNRLGLDGKPRQLHVENSLASIDFTDFEPTMDTPDGETLATCPHFRTDKKSLATGESLSSPDPTRFSILTVVEGELKSAGGRKYQKGCSLLLPVGASPVTATQHSILLQITLPG